DLQQVGTADDPAGLQDFPRFISGQARISSFEKLRHATFPTLQSLTVLYGPSRKCTMIDVATREMDDPMREPKNRDEVLDVRRREAEKGLVALPGGDRLILNLPEE